MKTCWDQSLQKAPCITIDLKEKLVSAAFAKRLCSSKPHWSQAREDGWSALGIITVQTTQVYVSFHFLFLPLFFFFDLCCREDCWNVWNQRQGRMLSDRVPSGAPSWCAELSGPECWLWNLVREITFFFQSLKKKIHA